MKNSLWLWQLKRRIRPFFITFAYFYTIIYLANKLFPRKTYAQNQEDIVCQTILGKIKVFIEIGANDGIRFSNTFKFALQGASGICFEPVYSNFFRMKYLYKYNHRIKCIKEGISNIAKEVEIHDEGLVSYIEDTQIPNLKESFSQKFPDFGKKSEKISVKPLDYWLDQYPSFRKCDLVSLDIEGHEFFALQGIDFSTFKTKCFVIETHAGLNPYSKNIDELLSKNGYQPVLMNKLNTIWLAKALVDRQKLQKIAAEFPEYQVLN